MLKCAYSPRRVQPTAATGTPRGTHALFTTSTPTATDAFTSLNPNVETHPGSDPNPLILALSVILTQNVILGLSSTLIMITPPQRGFQSLGRSSKPLLSGA